MNEFNLLFKERRYIQLQDGFKIDVSAFKDLLNLIPDSICIIDNLFRIRYANNAFSNYFSKNITEQYCYQIIHSKDIKCEDCIIHNCRTYMRVKDENIKKDGKIFQVLQFPLFNIDDSKFFLEIIKDVTRIKNLESDIKDICSKFDRSKKFAVLGHVASEIAHDIKNPLSAIKIFTQLVPRRIDEKSFMERFLITVPRELDRIDKLVEDLLEISRKPKLNLIEIDLNNLISQIVDIYKVLARGRNISIIKRCKRDLPKIKADPDKLNKAFNNILKNSIEALPNGGHIDICADFLGKGGCPELRTRGFPKLRTKQSGVVGIERGVSLFTDPNVGKGDCLELQEDRGLSRITDEAKRSRRFGTVPVDEIENKYIKISFHDSGKGINQSTLQNLFEPYYTTKKAGTGLGLYITQKIIKEHKGEICIESVPNCGTKITICLPINS